MDSASATVRVEALPKPARTPLEVVAPGSTTSRLVPRLAICSSTAAFAPCPTATMATSAATPMNTPSMVNAERSLLRASALPAATRAMRANDHNLPAVAGAGAAAPARYPAGGEGTATVGVAAWRRSATTTPSRIVTTRSAKAAMSASCVTSTTVKQRSRLSA